MDPATYIVLLIMRSLDTTQTAALGSESASLMDPVLPLLAKREIKVGLLKAPVPDHLLIYPLFQRRPGRSLHKQWQIFSIHRLLPILPVAS